MRVPVCGQPVQYGQNGRLQIFSIRQFYALDQDTVLNAYTISKRAAYIDSDSQNDSNSLALITSPGFTFTEGTHILDN